MDWSESLDRVGDVLRSKGEREEALKNYRESLSLCEKVVKDFGETPESLRDWSISLDRVGDILLSEGEREEALKNYRESFRLREKVMKDFGETQVSLRDIFVTQVKLVQVAQAAGDWEEFSQALAVMSLSLQRVIVVFGLTVELVVDYGTTLIICAQVRGQFKNEELPQVLHDATVSIFKGAGEFIGENEGALLAMKEGGVGAKEAFESFVTGYQMLATSLEGGEGVE